jgi:hypothetical protein
MMASKETSKECSFSAAAAADDDLQSIAKVGITRAVEKGD